ncbi:MAG TPA: hypothetical protein VHO84_04960, partial [Syntrophorhabdaceae bacterium]|nr:hypothetical protein [Syntrophorhabdaceae bacterium]
MSYAFRRFPIGAEVIPGEGVHFRIWAGNHSDVDLVVEPRPNSDFMDTVKIEMDGETNGYFSILVPQVSHGCLYMFEIE